VSGEPVYVTADSQRLKQVLINLVSNAIKYNVAGGEVWLACKTSPEGWRHISVRDTGQGIPLEQQPRLFQPFERLNAERSAVEGTGLGLALSKRLVELMGGQITVESAPGAGSTFGVDLPFAEQPVERENHQKGAGPVPDITGPTRTIIYIEDNHANYELVQQLLAEGTPVELVWAMLGSVGLDLARQRKPDLILLDLHLLDMHGSQVLAHLQQDAATRAIPVIVISADATPEQIARSQDAGANAYLTKPLNVPKFLHTVQTLLKEN